MAVDSLSYSGRLVNTNGSPVTGPVNLQFKLSYTNAPTVTLCNKTINNVALSNGVFHTKLDFSVVECGGTLSLSQVLMATPLNESVAIQVTDLSHTKTYSYQAIHSVPTSLVANTAKTLDQMGAANGEYLKWNGTKWIPAAAGTGSGSVTQIDTGTGLSGGPITGTGTISIANGGVDTTQLANLAVTDAKVATAAGIARSKLAAGTPNYVLVNDVAGVMTGVATLPIAQGGTGASTVPGVWTALGLGTAAGKAVGDGVGDVMAADAVPYCLPTHKLQMSLGPTFSWTCAIDDNTDTTKLPLLGGEMAGDIDMDGNQILNLSAPIVGSDAANKTYVDNAVAGSSVWAVGTGNAYRLTGNVGVGTATPARNIEVLNSDTDEALRITRAANASDEATIGFVPSGATSATNQTWKMGLPVNSNSFSLSAYDGSSTTSVLLLSPVGMVIPRLTTTERDAVVSPSNGLQIYNTSSNEINYYNGTAWKALGVAGAGVTSLVAGTGLTGGTITSSGTIAVDVGVGANKIVQLNGSSQLPAIDGSLLTNLTPANLSAPVPITKGGTGLNANGAGNTLVGMNNAGTAMEYKAITGTGVTVTNTVGGMNFAVTGAPPTGAASGDLGGTYPSPTVVALQGTAIAAGAPSSGNILLYNGTSYAPTAVSGDATISSAGAVTLATVPVTKGGTGVTSLTGKGIVSVNAAGTGLVSTACANLEVLSFNASGDAVCSPISSLVSSSFIQNGNSFGAAAVLGTNDNNSLNFETNGITNMTILPNGNIGVATLTPRRTFHVSGGSAVIRVGPYFPDVDATQDRDYVELVADGQDSRVSSMNERFHVENVGGPLILQNNVYNVGIGVIAPTSKLHIKDGGITVQDAPVVGSTRPSFVDVQNGLDLIKIHSKSGSGAGYVTAPSENLYLGSGSNEQALTIQLDGTVGIGTNAPVNKLHIVGGNSAAGMDGIFHLNSTTGLSHLLMGINDSNVGSEYAWIQTHGSKPLYINQLGNNTVLNLNAGNVGLGKAIPTDKLDVNGNIALNGKVRLQDSGSNFVELKAPATVTSTYTLTFPATAGTSGYALTTNGSGVLSWASVATSASSVGGDLSGTIASAEIVANAVGTAEIANGAVTYAKMTIADGEIPFAKIAPFTTTNVPEGTNWYFTDARVSAALLSSYAVGTAIPLAPTDTLNQALGKLEAQIVANNTANGDMWDKNSPHIYYNDGNVGIGTNSPTSKLHVVGDHTVTSGLGNLGFNADYAGGAFIQSFLGPGVYRPLSLEGSAVSVIGKSSDINLIPASNVNLGVDSGSTFPAYGTILNFLGHSSSTDALWMGRYNTALNVTELRMNIGDDYGAAQDKLVIGATDASWHPLMTVMANGTVGIGSSNPIAPLHAVGGEVLTAGWQRTMRLEAGHPAIQFKGTAEASHSSWIAHDDIAATGGLSFWVGGTGNNMAADSSRAMIIRNDGKVGIGTGMPATKLDVNGETRLTNSSGGQMNTNVSNREFDFSNNNAANRILTVHAGPLSGASYNDTIVDFYGHNGTSAIAGFSLNRMGNVGIGMTLPSERLEVNGNAKATAFLYTSDKRLKKDIKPLKNSLKKVIALNGVEFIWRKTGESETGLIAQDVEKVVPNLVETSSVDGMKSVKYGNIVALLIESTKEQHEEVRQAKREIASLQEENRKLKADLELIKKHLKIK